MSVRTVTVKLAADVAGFVSSLGKAEQATKKTADAALAASKAELAYRNSVDQATATIRDNGKTLDLTTAQGRANQKVLNDMAQSGSAYVKSLEEQGASAEDLAKAQQDVKVTLAATAQEMGKTEAEAMDLADAMTAAAKDPVNFWDDNRQAINDVSLALTGAGLALVAFAAAAVKTFADFDKSMSGVAATGEDARNNITALRAEAIKLGADTAFSAGEAADGITELLKAGVSAQDTLQGGLKGALDLAAAGEIAVGDAAEIAATALTQFKLKGADVPHVADLLAAAAGKAQGGVEDIAQALKQGGLVASQFGLTIEETTGGLAAFASAGLLGSDAGTSMKTMLLALARPSDAAAAALKDAGVNAYDAQGKFVGLTALAGQLRDGMKDMTDEQRQSTLATIFGTDAIRAASILYDEGAEGIAKWTDEVNESGYAAKTAATLQDNLNGDIEKLRGSLDTLLISGGSGSGGLLRGFVQTAEAAVDWLNKLDPAVVSAATAFIGISGGILLAAGAGLKMVASVRDMASSFRQVASPIAQHLAQIPKIEGGWKKAAVAGGALAVAMAGIAVVKTTGFMQGQTAAAEEYTSALIGLAKGGDGAADAMNRLLDAGVEGEAGTSVKDLSTAFKQLKENMNPVNNTISAMGDALGGLSTSQRQVQRQFEAMDQALSQMDASQAAEAFKEIQKSAADAGVSNEQLLATFPEYKKRLQEVANQISATDQSFDASKLTVEDYAKWMGGEVPEAVKKAAAGNKDVASAVERVSSSSRDAAQALEAYTQAMEEQAEAALAASNSEIDYQQSLDDAQQSIKEYRDELIKKYKDQGKSAEQAKKMAKADIDSGKALDITTEAGRKNQRALNDLLATGKKHIQDLKDQKATAETVSKAQNDLVRDYVNTAVAMGKPRDEAVKLAREMNLIPRKVSSEISAPGSKPTKAQIEEINRGLEDVDEGARAEIVSKWIAGGYKEAKKALDSLKPKSITVNITPHMNPMTGNTNVGRLGGKEIYLPYASGGVLPGYTPGRDVHLFRSATAGNLALSGGEAIMRPEWVRQVGGPAAVDAMNAAARRGQAFADGGVYQGPTRYAPVQMTNPQAGVSTSPGIGAVNQYFTQTDPNAAFIAAGQRLKGYM